MALACITCNCGRQVGCAQCISGWVLRGSQTDGTSINGARTVYLDYTYNIKILDVAHSIRITLRYGRLL